jgi:hypothetical protein
LKQWRNNADSLVDGSWIETISVCRFCIGQNVDTVPTSETYNGRRPHQSLDGRRQTIYFGGLPQEWIAA